MNAASAGLKYTYATRGGACCDLAGSAARTPGVPAGWNSRVREGLMGRLMAPSSRWVMYGSYSCAVRLGELHWNIERAFSAPHEQRHALALLAPREQPVEFLEAAELLLS